MKMFENTSKINYANPNTKSLKAGIPKEIVKILEVSPGDKMKWSVDVDNNKIRVIVSKDI